VIKRSVPLLIVPAGLILLLYKAGIFDGVDWHVFFTGCWHYLWTGKFMSDLIDAILFTALFGLVLWARRAVVRSMLRDRDKGK